MQLVRVVDRATEYDPPSKHLGEAIDDIGPIAVGTLMVRYIEFSDQRGRGAQRAVALGLARVASIRLDKSKREFAGGLWTGSSEELWNFRMMV